MFFDFKRTGPIRRGNLIYYNWECDSLEEMRNWFRLEEKRDRGLGMAMLRQKLQVLVMARPPLLIEHCEGPETELLKVTCGLMTLNCKAVVRFARAPAESTSADDTARLAAATRDEDYAWSLIKEMVERGVKMDTMWYVTLGHLAVGEMATKYYALADVSDSEAPESEEEEHPG